MAEVTLLDFWASPYATKCRLALLEKGVKYESKEETGLLSKKSELLLKTNPIHKKIPVLIHNGKPVCESGIIVEYIDEVWSDVAPFFPKDAYGRAHARFWANYVDQKVFECGARCWKHKGEPQVQAKNEFIGIIKLLEGELGDKKFFGGDSFGFVDINLIAFTPWFYTFEKHADFSVEEEAPKFEAWRKRCLEKESVAKALPAPEPVHDFVNETLKKVFGIE